MFKSILAAIACATITIGAAQAGTVENSFGNTIVSRAPDGAVTRWQYSPNGSYTMTSADGQTTRGAWAYVNGELCLTPEGGAQTCHGDGGDYHVGDTWTLTGPDGQSTTITIEAGQ
ncbi:MAG: hypothetical protein NW206_15940 [Hyphomonadaceae bacterium]|nr:hypothetical protein [Hyphomonadaceae bacterium]